jgi:hypothetical protein
MSGQSFTSTRQTTLHQTSISYLSSTVTSPPENDPFHGFSFTQEAAKKHKPEFSLVNKLSGKPGKSKILKKLGSKITSRQSKEKYQLTISAAKQACNKNNLAADINGLTLLKRRVVDQLYNNVMSPAVGVNILKNLELAFPFVPKTTRSHERLRTTEELVEQYKVEFNDLIETKKIDEEAKKKTYCLFAYNRPKMHRLKLWKLSQLPPITYTAADVLELHKEDNQYYNLRFVQRRTLSNSAIVTDEETHGLNHNFGSTVTSREDETENDDSMEKDYPVDASVNDSFEDMDDSVIITMENSNTSLITTKFTQNGCMGDVITFDSSPANSPPARFQNPCSLLDLSPRHEIAFLSPRPSKLLATSPSDPITVLSIPETPSLSEKLTESLSPFPTVPVETVEVIEIPESPIAENDDFNSHFKIIEHAAAKFGLQNTSPQTVASSLTMPSPVHGNNRKSYNSSNKSEKQDFSKLSTPQLREQMDKWGFKPVRTRKAMIELLESCNVVVEPVEKAIEEEQAVEEVLPDLTLQVVDKMSTGEMKKTLSKLGIKHSGSRSQMTSILVSWSQNRNGNHGDSMDSCNDSTSSSNSRANKHGKVSQIVESVNSNLSEKILEAIKMEHEKHSVNSLWTRMLCYEPISLDELVAYLESTLAVKLDDKFVRSWCDAHGVTTTTVNSLDG